MCSSILCLTCNQADTIIMDMGTTMLITTTTTTIILMGTVMHTVILMGMQASIPTVDMHIHITLRRC